MFKSRVSIPLMALFTRRCAITDYEARALVQRLRPAHSHGVIGDGWLFDSSLR
jgi:hypothetical protein